MPKPWARSATSWPIRPNPRMPSVLSISSMPEYFERSQRPATSARVGLRDVARERQQQRHRVLGRGDDVRLRRVGDDDAALGRLGDVDVVDADARRGRPPCRCSACDSASASSFVAERIRMPSKPPIRSSSCSRVQSKPVSTSKPASRSSSIPDSPMFSATSTLVMTLPPASGGRRPSRCRRSAPARRPGRSPGTCRRAAGCGRACGRARRRRRRWRAASRRRRPRRRCRRSRSCRRRASAWPGRRRTASRTAPPRPRRRGGPRTPWCARRRSPGRPAAIHPVELLDEQDQRRRARACCRSGP